MIPTFHIWSAVLWGQKKDFLPPPDSLSLTQSAKTMRPIYLPPFLPLCHWITPRFLSPSHRHNAGHLPPQPVSMGGNWECKTDQQWKDMWLHQLPYKQWRISQCLVSTSSWHTALTMRRYYDWLSAVSSTSLWMREGWVDILTSFGPEQNQRVILSYFKKLEMYLIAIIVQVQNPLGSTVTLLYPREIV